MSAAKGFRPYDAMHIPENETILNRKNIIFKNIKEVNKMSCGCCCGTKKKAAKKKAVKKKKK
jgi:hypothetical protein